MKNDQESQGLDVLSYRRATTETAVSRAKDVPPTVKIMGLDYSKRAVKTLGGRVIDRRTSLGKALDQWRSDLLRDLGGSEEVSTQKLALVDLAVKTKLMVDSLDN